MQDQLFCPRVHQQINIKQNVTNAYNGILFSLEKEGISCTCCYINELEGILSAQ